jgi:pyruvate/2-oxoglutarate dehydrogenase complex dihydrolipoamide acyltransferase (E2) component
VTLLALLVVLLFVAGAVYKWVDKEGKVHYSDKPPPGQESQAVAVPPGPTAEQQAQAAARLQALKDSAHPGAAAAAQATEPTPPPDTAPAERVGPEIAARVCADARVQRMTLDLQMPVYRRGPGGERTFLADAERPAAKKQLDAAIAEYCSDEPAAKAAQQQRFIELSLGRRPACVELRNTLEVLKARPAREAAEQIQQVMDRLNSYRCPAVPVDGVWLAQWNYELQAPPDD